MNMKRKKRNHPIIKKIIKVLGCRKIITITRCSGNVKYCSCTENSLAIPQIVKNRDLTEYD